MKHTKKKCYICDGGRVFKAQKTRNGKRVLVCKTCCKILGLLREAR